MLYERERGYSARVYLHEKAEEEEEDAEEEEKKRRWRIVRAIFTLAHEEKGTHISSKGESQTSVVLMVIIVVVVVVM